MMAMKTILNNINRNNGRLTPVHFKTTLIASRGNNFVDVNALLDTGALCANYISSNLYAKIRKSINHENIKHIKTRVGLADDKTFLFSDTVVALDLKLHGTTTTTYQGPFVVLDMKDNEIIIGLPAIINSLWDFFKANIEHNKKVNQTSIFENRTLFTRNEHNSRIHALTDLVQPWSHSQPECECPEEQTSPLPTNFGSISEFLGKPRAEALTEYQNMFKDHICEDFRKAVPIEKLLMEKGASVFVPEKWTGIEGIEPLEIKFQSSLPQRIKPKSRPINPRLYEATEKEFIRLRGYIYVKSSSPWASCLTVAPKATKPFIRLCGDYRTINSHMEIGHFYIPNVRHQLNRIIEYSIFLDIDLTNAFHQIPLHPNTAEKLSLQTPWGQFQPLFVPEGIGPGSGKLQQTIMELFGDIEWAICMFDNILVLASSHEDAYTKMNVILDRCIQHKVVLKFAKTWLGYTQVHFFGYNCKHKSYELTDDRKKALLEIPFPENGNRQRKARSLLGCGVFFSPFIANYKDRVKHLTDLTRKDFNWDEATWKVNYRQEWEQYKEELQNSCAIYYPDYSLDWILRTDASLFGVGGCLVQIATDTDGTKEEQVIAICSQKFSEVAKDWATIEQEGYGIFYSVKKFAYYLIGKPFIIETDHQNLKWMEASEVPKIIRWRIYLQSFTFQIKHIKGTKNILADALSRLLLLTHAPGEYLPPYTGLVLNDSPDNFSVQYLNAVFADTGEQRRQEIKGNMNSSMSEDEVLEKVHNCRVGHFGILETWTRLNKSFPGHQMSMDRVREFVTACANCQKTRKEQKNRLVKVKRNLKPPHSRSAIGIDAVKITPAGKEGHTHVMVILNLFTKHIYLHAIKGVTAQNLTVAVWNYWCNFGHTDMIISDLGSDLNSHLFAELVELMGMRHVFSIADKHANGTERSIKEVNRHLRAIVYDERIKDVFDDPTIIPTVQYILNSHISKETNYSPFELMFGSMDKNYNKLFEDKTAEPSHVLLKRLNNNLEHLRETSHQYQQELVLKRESGQDPDKHNTYQAGDLVLFDSGSKTYPKMAARYKGPYEVINQYRNDVNTRNLLTDAVKMFSVEDLEPFNGSRAAAEDAALRDQEQFKVTAVLAYTGDSRKRTQLLLTVEYADGDVLDVPWTPDIQQCEAYQKFCTSPTRPYLYHLSLDASLAKQYITRMRKEDITLVNPGDTVFVDLRFFGDLFYESLGLPDTSTTSYVTPFQYLRWYHKGGSKKKIVIKHMLTGQVYSFDNYLVTAWGAQKVERPGETILVDMQFATLYPRILDVDGPVEH